MEKKLYRLLLLSFALGLGLVGCAKPQASPAGAAVAVEPPSSAASASQLGAEVDPETVASLAEDGAVAVIDVREDWEYQEGHIAGATLIPLGSLQDRVDEIPTDKPVILVCRSGNRSGQAFRYLSQEGFENVHNMTGGMIAWEAAGLEIAR